MKNIKFEYLKDDINDTTKIIAKGKGKNEKIDNTTYYLYIPTIFFLAEKVNIIILLSNSFFVTSVI